MSFHSTSTVNENNLLTTTDYGEVYELFLKHAA